jgi:3-phenylpropionate/trans-cinnamate dioxygenase ferredoxin reductase subunit
MKTYDVLIVGAGHAGAQVAQELRRLNYSGSIALLGDEPDPPYERPPLSKDYLAGERNFERMLIRPLMFWAQGQIDLLLGRRVVAVDAAKHRVALEDGEGLGYGRLVWATGGRPRVLTCMSRGLSGVHTIRSRGDVDRLREELAQTHRVAIIGGGYVGLEAAAVLTKLGKQVTVLEAADRVLSRVAGEPLSRFFEAEHRRHGVHLQTGVVVDHIEETNERASGVRLSSGVVAPADLVIVGIGISPAVEPLTMAGAKGGDGVKVDEVCRTSLPDVYAIGDCALHTSRFAGGNQVRLESLQNANDQARTVAKAVTGVQKAYDSVPLFWSNQYDLRLQSVGLSSGYDQLTVRGDIAARSFSVIYLRRGKVIALDCVNATRDYVQGRALVLNEAEVGVQSLSDVTIPLKENLAPVLS